MLHAHLAAPALAAIALATIGCGGSSKTGSSAAATTTAPAATTTTTTVALPTTTVKLATGRPLTRAELIAKADPICKRMNTKVFGIRVKSISEFASVTPQMAIYINTASADLGKLVSPARMTRDWARIVNGLQLYGEYVSKIGQYAQANDISAARQQYATAQNILVQMNTIGKNDGFIQCP